VPRFIETYEIVESPYTEKQRCWYQLENAQYKNNSTNISYTNAYL